NDDSDGPSGVFKWQYIIGFLFTLRAFALHSLSLSLMHLPFQKVLKRETYSVVLEMQFCTAVVATCVSITFCMEVVGFAGGRVSYVMTLVWTAVAWQVCFVDVVLTASLAITSIASMIVFHDKMNGIKEIDMLLAIWGFASHN
ncbi:putative purine permease 11, partial [Quercus suber]